MAVLHKIICQSSDPRIPFFRTHLLDFSDHLLALEFIALLRVCASSRTRRCASRPPLDLLNMIVASD
jgi:hypothetical protein